MNFRVVGLFFFSMIFLLSHAQDEYYFPPTEGNWTTQSPEDLGWCVDSIDALYDFLERNDTRAFLLLKDGRIVFEKYFYNFHQDSVWYWASAGKTLTAFLAGTAQEQGYLSIDDPSSKYLGDWTSASTEREDSILIWHQLTMTTGLDDNVDNLDCTDRACLNYLADPGTRWSYHNAPYTLLSEVIEEATDQNYNLFTRNSLMSKIGGSGAWIRLDYNRVFFSSPRTMARFGLLILARGEWGNERVMEDKQYIDQMISPSQQINPSYGYLWWLNGQEGIMVPGVQRVFNQPLCPPAPDDMVAAMGKNSQLLNVVPSEGLVVVRMGESPSGAPVPFDLQDGIWEYLNQIICSPTNQEEVADNANEIYPNPVVSGEVNIKTLTRGEPGVLRLNDLSGRPVYERKCAGNEGWIDLPVVLANGLYTYSYQSRNGDVVFGKLIITGK